MDKIRKGIDIRMEWTITTDGKATPLEGRDLKLLLIGPIGCKTELPFTTSGNVLTAWYYGKDHAMYGKHHLTLWENYGLIGQNAVDKVDAFCLVRTTEDMQSEVHDNLKIKVVNLGTANFRIGGGSGGSGPVHWDQILGKPKIPTHLKELKDDAQHRTVSDEQIEKWNAGGNIDSNDIFNAVCDSALVSPVISSVNWTIKNSNGDVVSADVADARIRGNNIEVENGFSLIFVGKWKWTTAEGKKKPSRTSGSWGTALPASGVDSASLTKDKIKANTTLSQSIYAAKSGVSVVGGKLVRPSGGEDSASCSVAANFSHRYYYGLLTTDSPSGEDIKGMAHSDLSNSKARTIKGITNDISHYWCYAYPKVLGTLNSAVYNGAMQIFEDFILKEVSVVNKAGVSVVYNVYVFKNVDAFNDSVVEFK